MLIPDQASALTHVPKKFAPPDVEREFLNQYRRSALRLVRMAFLLGAALALVFFVLVILIKDDEAPLNPRQVLRLALFVAFACAAVMVAIRPTKTVEHYVLIVGGAVTLASISIGAMSLLPSDLEEPRSGRWTIAMSLACWLGYGFTRLPVRLVASACSVGSVAILASAQINGDEYVRALLVYLFMANLIGWIMSVEIERRERALFWSARQLSEATAALEEMARSASEAAAARKHVLAAVSHDLRQPVASLALYARLLRMRNDVLEPAGLLGTVSRVEACIAALSGNLDRLAELGGLRSGKAALPVSSVALGRVFERIESVYVAEASHRGVRLVIRHPRRGRGFVLSNEDRLWDVLSNLVGNALKFPALGTRSPWVLVGARRRGDRVVIEVHDNGIGIAPDDQRLVFDEYFQVANHARNPERGYGLGLSIVRETVARLPGHSIELASRSGRGTRFSLALPVATATEARRSGDVAAELRYCESPRTLYRVDAGVDGVAADAAGGKPLHDGRRDDVVQPVGTLAGAYVLLVEDDDSMRDALGCLLGQWGVLVEAAASGEEALRTAADAERLYEAIVSDFRLPGAHNGLQVIDEVRRIEGRRTPAVLLSGEFDVEALRAGAPADVQVMAKPVDVPRLRELLSDFASGIVPTGT